MKTKAISRVLIIVLVVVANIGCDQVSKNIVREKVGQNESISIIPDHLTIMNVENSGAFLSLGNSLPKTTKNILLSILPVLALIAGFVFLLTKKNISRSMLIGLSFVIGGGIGNLFDRVVHGSVTDFLHIHYGIFQTGIFNMADVSIMTGVFIILLFSLWHKKTVTQVS